MLKTTPLMRTGSLVAEVVRLSTGSILVHDSKPAGVTGWRSRSIITSSTMERLFIFMVPDSTRRLNTMESMVLLNVPSLQATVSHTNSESRNLVPAGIILTIHYSMRMVWQDLWYSTGLVLEIMMMLLSHIYSEIGATTVLSKTFIGNYMVVIQ